MTLVAQRKSKVKALVPSLPDGERTILGRVSVSFTEVQPQSSQRVDTPKSSVQLYANALNDLKLTLTRRTCYRKSLYYALSLKTSWSDGMIFTGPMVLCWLGIAHLAIPKTRILNHARCPILVQSQRLSKRSGQWLTVSRNGSLKDRSQWKRLTAWFKVSALNLCLLSTRPD